MGPGRLGLSGAPALRHVVREFHLEHVSAITPCHVMAEASVRGRSLTSVDVINTHYVKVTL